MLENLTLFIRVSIKLRTYLNTLESSINFFDGRQTSIQSDMEAIYKDAKASNNSRYANDIARYERLAEKIRWKNQDSKILVDFIESQPLSDILEDPNKVTDDQLNKYREIISRAERYPQLSRNISSFCTETKRTIDNIHLIKNEYVLHNQYLKNFEFDNYNFIDDRMKLVIDSKTEEILSKVDKQGCRFYDYELHADLDKLIAEHNREYIKKHINDPILSDVNGKSLDKEQRISVLTDEVSNLVIAGAGSGKTLTICGKVKYLLEVEHYKPEDILLLSYSNNSAEDLQKKIDTINKDIRVGTFHKIGLDILKESLNKTPLVEDQYNAIIESYFSKEMQKRPQILEKMLRYYALYLNDDAFDITYEDEGELYEDLKKLEFETLKDQLLSLTNDLAKKETIKKELVKSFEELAIANWYFLNGIEYIYEAPYEHDVSTYDKRQYVPDFKLKNYPIYHEHYGIDKNGKASQFGEEESSNYIANMRWKRELHETYNTDCIETYSYEFKDGTIFKKLEKELKKRGVEFKPLSEKDIKDALNSIYQNRPFKSFINLTKTFLNLYKSTHEDDSYFDRFKRFEYKNNYQQRRAELFLDIVKDIYQFYRDYLTKNNEIDFDDMILEAIKKLDMTDGYRYKYIIVDEFQDISVSRMKFLQRLIKQGNSKLFAVGDDWQAIYRFSGCDLNIFLEFEEYFGKSAITKISTTHRNSQELQDIVGPFIRKNPEQYDKVIKSNKTTNKPIRVMFYESQKYVAFLKILETISTSDSNASVLILGRNNKDLDDILLDERIFIDYSNSDAKKKTIVCSSYPKMKLTFSTVHGSKGLEDDYVILISADDRKTGFPNKLEDDELLNLVLSHKSKYQYAEERRLWYVALTRTRSYTFIIANQYIPSEFLKEIEDDCLIMNPDEVESQEDLGIKCPRCKSGTLILRQNGKNGSKFYGCTNYPYCEYRINDLKAVKENKRCPDCGDIMILKKGPYGKFYGCNNYPRCEHKEKYDTDDHNYF